MRQKSKKQLHNNTATMNKDRLQNALNLNLDSGKNPVFDNYFPLILTLGYALCVLIGMYYHELWRDELDIYARLYYNSPLKLNGPGGVLQFDSLFYLCPLQFLLKIIPSFITYQIYHLLIIVAAIYLFNRYSNFSYFHKFLFTFSYFMLFEYGIISRWYGFFVFIVFIITYLLTREKKNYILISIFLLILANHNISSAIFASSLAVYTIIHIFNRLALNSYSSEEKSQLIKSSIIFWLGSIFIISQYVYVFINQGDTFVSFGQAPFIMTIRTIWNSYIPIPDFTHGAAFWNTNIFPFPKIFPQNIYDLSPLTQGDIFTIVISILIILICLFIFSNKLPVLVTFLFNLAVYFIFINFVFRAYFTRHQGLLFIIFVYCCWLFKFSDENIRIPFISKNLSLKGTSINSKHVNKILAYLITIIFFFQFIAGVLVYPRSIVYQFTKSWDTASYIKTNNYNDYVLVGAIDYAVLPIAVILNREIFIPQTNRFSKMVDWWGVNRNPNVDLPDLIRKSMDILLHTNKRVLIILNREPQYGDGTPIENIMLSEKILLIKVKSFVGDVIQQDEQYFLYELIKT